MQVTRSILTLTARHGTLDLDTKILKVSRSNTTLRQYRWAEFETRKDC